ncbi:MAG: HEAT repeat domain-containing protein [Nitrospirota bacterium]|nr:HEAT repeat domain-containing protein [Nitrospirota bacterium]
MTARDCQRLRQSRLVAAALLLWIGLAQLAVAGQASGNSSSGSPGQGTVPIPIEREILAAAKGGHHDRAIRLFETLPAGQAPSNRLLEAAFQSYLRLGQAERALTIYTRLVPAGRPDPPVSLRDLARSFISGHARDPQEYVRIAAYTAMAEVGDATMLPLLEDGLLDSSLLVRARAVEGLGRVGERAKRAGKPMPTTALKRALQDPAPPVRIAALTALGDIGDPTDHATLDTMTQLARAGEGPIHVFALAALLKLGHAQALEEIINAATLPEPDVRMAAIGVLGRLKRPATLSLLAQSVYDPEESVRAFAAGALGEFGDPSAIGALTHAMGDDSPRVRSIAAVSVGRLGLAHAKPLLRQAARDPVELVRAGAVEGLLRLGEADAVLLAAELAKHDSPSARSAAAQALGLAGNRRALPVLEQLLADQQPQPRLAAARALGKVGDRAGLPPLKKALADNDPAIRITAAGSVLTVLAQQSREKG